MRSGRLEEIEAQLKEQREAARRALIARVLDAFGDVRLHGGWSLHQARALDDYLGEDEVRAARALDEEVRWQDIPDEKIHRLHDTLAFMDPEGFRFHLPRFMQFALEHLEERDSFSDSNACASAIYWADLRDSSDRFSLFSGEQRTVVQAFGDFYIDK